MQSTMSTMQQNYETDINNQKICRTCLKKVYKNSINIFEERKNDKLISDVLTECISITFKKDEALPMKMCNNCLKKLNLVLDFREMIIESDEKLLKSSQNTEVKNEEILVAKPGNDTDIDDNAQLLHYDKNKEIVDEKDIKITELAKDEINESFEACDSDIVEQEELRLEFDQNEDKKHDINTDKDEIDEDLLKNIDLSEYEHLKTTLTRHEKKKTRLVCKLCNKSVLYYYFFSVHLPQHLGKVPYKCDVCNKGFATNDALKQHKVTHNDTKPFTCELCGKSFKTIISLRSHVRVHTDDHPLECEICNKRFKFENSLTIHLRRHKGSKQFICEVCGKSFMDYSTLYAHTKIHDSESKFVCSVCGKAFKTNSRLKEHNKTHTNYKPYKCSYCDRSFISGTVLRNHLFIHTGDKPYSCKICGKTFRQNSCIGRHMRIHTGETPFHCKICPAKFKYSHHLLKHTKRHQ